MAVYVDPITNYGGSATFRWKDSCHCYANTIEELHAFAKRIGLKRSWFQDKSLPHYDLNRGRHAAAIKAGAVQHTHREAYDFWKEKGWLKRRQPTTPPPVTGELFG